MARPRSFDASDLVPDANTTDNLETKEVLGNKADSAAGAVNNTNSVVAYVKAIFSATVAGGQINWQQSDTSNLDEDGGRYSFDVGVVDRDTGAVASANINIASAVVTLEKSTAGGAFSTVGITQPTVAKADGLVTVSADVVATEWQVGDHFKATLTTVSATNSASGTEFMPSMVWMGEIVEDFDVKTTVDDIDTDLGEPTDANSAATVHGRLKVATADDTANTLLIHAVGNKSDAGSAASTASLVALSRLLVDTYAATTGTADSGTTTTMVDAERTEAAASDLEGQMLIFTTGNNDRVARIIVDFDPATDTITVAPAYADAIAAGDKYVIIPADFANALDLALNATGVAIATNSLADQLYIGASEQLRTFIAKTGGTAIGTSKSIVNAIGNTGDAPVPAADNATAAGSSSLQATLGRKDDTSLGVTATAGTTNTLFRAAQSVLDRTATPAAADNTTAAGSARLGETLGRKDDAAATAVNATNTALNYLKGVQTSVGFTGDVANESGSVNAKLASVLGDVDTLRDTAITAPTTNTIEDQLFVAAGEQLRKFIALTGGKQVATGKSILDALGSDGSTVTDSAVSVLGAIGADNANNAFASTNVVANRDGSLLERNEQVIQNVGTWNGVTTGTHTQTAAGGTGEQEVLAVTGITTPTHVLAYLDFTNLTQSATVRFYMKVDGTNYRSIDPEKAWTTADEDGIAIDQWVVHDYKITIASSVAEDADRSVPFRHTRLVAG